MLITQSSLLCPPPKFSFGKCSKTNIPLLFSNNNNNNLEIKNRVSGKTAVLYNGYSYFTSPCHPLQLELVGPDDDNINQGIGILKFFEGKNILVTGATGLVGKVLVEKILRSTPVGKIYVLIKAKDKESAFDRLTNEIINSDLFKCLKEEHGKFYDAFVREKLIPIVGNICEPNIGMDSDSAETLRKDVHVIIQSAASTTLNDRYDSLLDSNMNAPQRLMRFGKTCKNLMLFTHISTAYVNGRKEGTIYEKSLFMGENGRNELCDDEFPPLDVADEIKMILKASAASTDYDATKILKKLGQDRASFFGWYNAYHMTKAMGEMILNETRGDVPLLIIRPAVIESSHKEPFPGWIQGNRMFDPVIISYGKGRLPAFFGSSQVVMDVIPVDMVVNTMIAAIAKEGSSHKSQVKVYHVGSSETNPLKFSDFFEYLYEYFNSSPLVESLNISRIEYFNNFGDFSKYVREEMGMGMGLHKPNSEDEKMMRKMECQCKAKVAYAEQLCKMYDFIGFFNARFDTSNNRKLIEEMSTEEQLSFEVDARNIEWRRYFQEIHIPGLRKHIINGTRTTCT